MHTLAQHLPQGPPPLHTQILVLQQHTTSMLLLFPFHGAPLCACTSSRTCVLYVIRHYFFSSPLRCFKETFWNRTECVRPYTVCAEWNPFYCLVERTACREKTFFFFTIHLSTKNPIEFSVLQMWITKLNATSKISIAEQCKIHKCVVTSGVVLLSVRKIPLENREQKKNKRVKSNFDSFLRSSIEENLVWVWNFVQFGCKRIRSMHRHRSHRRRHRRIVGPFTCFVLQRKCLLNLRNRRCIDSTIE